MSVPYSETLDLATLSGLKRLHTLLIHAILSLRVVIQVRFHLKLSLRSGKTFRTYVSLVRDAGRRFPLGWEHLNLIHGVLSAASSDMLLGEVTTKYRILPPTEYLSHEMLCLRRVSLIGHQRVRGRTYQFSRQALEKIHPLIKDLTHQSLTLMPPINTLLILPLIAPIKLPITILSPPINTLSILPIKLIITTLSIQTLPLSPWNNDDQLVRRSLRKLEYIPWNTRSVRLLGETKA